MEQEIKWHEPVTPNDQLHYMGSTLFNGGKVLYIIYKDSDIIVFDTDMVVKAAGRNVTVEEFLSSDALLDAASVYRQLTGKEYTIDYIDFENNTEKGFISDIKNPKQWESIKNKTLH